MQKSRSVATSANPRPAQEIPAESPWRLGESLALYRPAQPRLLPGHQQRLGGRRESCTHHGFSGVPGAVTPWGGLCPAVAVRRPHRAAGVLAVGAAGSALHPASPPGCLQWEHWCCTHSPVQCRIRPLPGAQRAGCALGAWVMLRDMRMGSRAAFFPSPTPSTASQCHRGSWVGGFGFRPPPQSSRHLPQSPHLRSGCAHGPITARVPRAVSHVGHLLPCPGAISSPKPHRTGAGGLP